MKRGSMLRWARHKDNYQIPVPVNSDL